MDTINEKEQKCLAFIGAGLGILPFLNKAKEMGVKTVAFARGKDSVSKDKIDVFVEEDSFDIKFMAEKCKELNVNGIIAISDFTTEIAAKVAHEAGLPGNDIESGFTGRNKYIMRCRVQNLKSVKQPKFELYNKEHEYRFPIVVKAVDSAGKRGVSLAKKSKEFIEAIKYAQDNSSDGTALIEEYLEGGKEYSIECLAYNGGSQIIQYTEKDSAGAPHFVELGHHQPAALTEIEKDKINKATKDILKVLGIRCGMAHLELKIIDGEVYFIEVGARYGGDNIAETLVALSTDFDYFKAAIEASFGEYKPREVHNVSHAGIYFYCKQNEKLLPLFKEPESVGWCFEKKIECEDLHDIESNAQAHKSGYLIYNADSKITINNYKEETAQKAVEINKFHDAYQLFWNHFREVGYDYTDERLDLQVKASLAHSHVIGVLKNKHVLAFMLLYCNHYDTLDAYMHYLHVLQGYRRLGYTTSIFNKSFEICKLKGFKSVRLDVVNTNILAFEIYNHYGFIKTGNTSLINDEEAYEMRYYFK